MANGEVYAQVDASVVNSGIAPMGIVSGNQEPESGQQVTIVWIRWWYDDTTGDGGYTGQGWFFNDSNNVIGSGSEYATEEEFKAWLVENQPESLDNLLGQWDAEKKLAFMTTHWDRLSANCLGIGLS